MTQPVIGISGSLRHHADVLRAGVNAAYAHAVARSGAIPMVLTPAIEAGLARQVLSRLDGLLLTGGPDIAPERYGARPSAALGPVDAQRDALELALFHAAREQGMPILGICRGVQLVNVALGGTLWQDLPSERPGPIAHDPPLPRKARSHDITVEEDSRLHGALSTGALRTNSIHHQAISALPDGYRAVFLMHDVEGYTHDEIARTLGVQPGTSKAQLFRARAKLRTALAEFAPEGGRA